MGRKDGDTVWSGLTPQVWLPTNRRSIITVEVHPKNSGYEQYIRLPRLGILHKEDEPLECSGLKARKAYV